MDRRGTGRWILLFLLLAVLLGLSILGVVYTIENYNRFSDYVINSETPNNKECNDYDECTLDYLRSDGSCIHRQKKINSSCNNDICYGNATNKRCCDDGKCVSSRYNCIGICPNGGFQYQFAANCSFDMFPLNYAQFDLYFLSCIYGSCTLTALQFWAEKRPLDESYLFNISSCNKNANFVKSKCIDYFCTTSAGNTVCLFRYRCATFNFTTNVMDSSIGGNSNVEDSSNESSILYFPSFSDSMSRKDYQLIDKSFNDALKETLKTRGNVKRSLD